MFHLQVKQWKNSFPHTAAVMGFADAAGSYHLCNASVGKDVACMDESVQHLSRLLYQVTLVGIVLQLLICRQNIVGFHMNSDSWQRWRRKIVKRRQGILETHQREGLWFYPRIGTCNSNSQTVMHQWKQTFLKSLKRKISHCFKDLMKIVIKKVHCYLLCVMKRDAACTASASQWSKKT